MEGTQVHGHWNRMRWASESCLSFVRGHWNDSDGGSVGYRRLTLLGTAVKQGFEEPRVKSGLQKNYPSMTHWNHYAQGLPNHPAVHVP